MEPSRPRPDDRSASRSISSATEAVAAVDGGASLALDSGQGEWGLICMERRKLLAASSVALAWMPLRDLRAQTLAQATGATAPPATAPAAAPASTASASADKPFTAAQLDQLLAP